MIEVEVWRENTAARINRLINLPEVRPWVEDGDHELDVTANVQNPANFLLMGEHGGMLVAKLQPGIYECHTVVHPSARGRWSRGFTASCAHWMFTRTDCYEGITRVPKGHVAALAGALAAGMKMEFTLPESVMFRGKRVDIHVLSYRIQDWMQIAPGLEQRGEWFHRRLAAEAKRLGITDQPHEDWPIHNRYVGACVDMAFAGQGAKATLLYNRWALASRHPTVKMLDHNKIQFDIGVLLFRDDGDIEVSLP